MTAVRPKRRRGTVIIECPDGILLTRMKGDKYLLPGGNAERGELRINAAIRELQEETGLEATAAWFLFEHESAYYRHKVFYLRATGTPRPKNEVERLGYWPNEPEMALHASNVQIIKRFLSERDTLLAGYQLQG